MILSQNEVIVKLSSGQVVNVPDGADPESFRRFEEAKLARAGKPQPKTKPRRRTYRSTKKWSAANILSGSGFFNQRESRSAATVELVARANGAEVDR